MPISLPTPKLPLPKLPKLDPESRSWKLLSLPIAAVLVVGGLLLLRGGDDAPAPARRRRAGDRRRRHRGRRPASKDGRQVRARRERSPRPSKDTEFVRESSFSLALPAGWERIEPPAGATFAAVAADGSADATLWITQDPKLDFPTFITQSLHPARDARGLGADRRADPGADRREHRRPARRRRARGPADLRGRPCGSPARTATTWRPASSRTPRREVADGVDLITGTFTPELEG